MSSAGFPSRSSDHSPSAGTPAPGASTTHNLLEQVLQQTARQAVCEDASADSVRRELQGVAERHRGRPFEFDPVAVDLVHASLSAQFALLGSVERDWRPMSVRIARVLFDDPVACERLRSLWSELSGRS